MPDVPNAPGVPSLSSYLANAISLLAADAIDIVIGNLGFPQWGIYLDGAPAFDFNSVVDFTYKQEWTISDYPVEEGGFQSYDTVQLPFDIKVRIASGGSEMERQALLDAVDAAANTLDLYDVVTPEKIYSSCNIMHYDYKRTSTNGVGMIIIDIWFVEIRVTATAALSNTQNPTNAGTQSNGNVSAADVGADAPNIGTAAILPPKFT